MPIAALPFVLLLATAPATPELALRWAAIGSGSLLGVAATHVESGRTETLNGRERFAMASTYKLPVAIALERAVEKGAVSLDAPVAVGPKDVRHGIGRQLGAGTYTVRTLAEAMLQESDNTATDALFRLLGGPRSVAAALRELGIEGIDVSRTEGEIFADVRARRSAPGDARDTASPEAMAALLVKLGQGKLLSPGRTAELLGWMRGCRTGDARIRAGVPKGTEVADKTGTMEPTTSDVGLVTLPDGTHLALAVYVTGGRDREKTIAAVAREAWLAFGGK